MKSHKIIPFFLIALICTFVLSCSNNNRHKTPDAVAEAVFDIFVKDDVEKLEKTIIMEEDPMYNFMKKMQQYEIDTLPNNEKAKLQELKAKHERQRKNFKYEYPKYKQSLRNSFKKVRNAAIDDGVLWETAKFKKAEYEVKVKRGQKTIGSLLVIFEVGSKEFAIDLGDYLYIDEVWISGEDNIRWEGRR